MQKRDNEEGRSHPSETSSHSTDIPRQGFQSLKVSPKFPFLNPDALNQWSGPENKARVKIDGESSWAHLDSGSTINVVTTGFIEACSLDISPLSDLTEGTLGIDGFGEGFSQPLGYIIIRVQVEGVLGYDEDQVALVALDSTVFGAQIFINLGTSLSTKSSMLSRKVT